MVIGLSSLHRTPVAGVSRVLSKKQQAIGLTAAKIDLVWEVGGFAKSNPGDSVCASVETGPKGAPQEWKLTFYPRGFVDPVAVSFFVTNVGCMQGQPPPANAEITATVSVSVAVADTGTNKSGYKSGSARKVSSGKEHKRSSSEPRTTEICRKFSRTFSTQGHTFGFENFTDWSVLFGKDSPYQHRAREGEEGTLQFQISISVSISPPLAAPEVDISVRNSGWQRVLWVLPDFKGLIENTPPGCKFSSPCFHVNGEWYFDIFPSGYKAGEANSAQSVSIYLHSSKRQADRGDILKKTLRFGMKRMNPLPAAFYSALNEDPADDVCWAKSGDVTAIFTPKQRSAGCQSLVGLTAFAEGRAVDKMAQSSHKIKGSQLVAELVAGKFDKGGSVTIVLDLLVTDQVHGQVHEGLFLRALPSGEGSDLIGTCRASKRPFALPAVFGGAAGKPSRCYMCGYVFSDHLLSVGPHTRLPQFGYEVGRVEMMDVCLREGPSSTAEALMQDLHCALSKSAVWRSAEWLEELVRAPVEKINDEASKLHALVFVSALGLSNVQTGRPGASGALARAGMGDGGGGEASGCREEVSGLAKKRAEAEERRQKAFEERLTEMRNTLEDAVFAKPVCSKCDELCKCLRSLPSLVAGPCGSDVDAAAGREHCDKDGAGRRTGAPRRTGYAQGWREARSECEAALSEGAGRHASSCGRGARSVACLARGGVWGEPPELAVQCTGRVNSHRPLLADLSEDFALDSFCDVRFDRMLRRGILGGKVPHKVHCTQTGKVVCPDCAAYKLALPHHSDDPEAFKEMAVCREAFLEARMAPERGRGRVQYVTQRRGVPAAPPERVQVSGGGDAAGDDDDDDDEGESVVGYLLRRVPLVGPSLADNVAAAVPGLP